MYAIIKTGGKQYKVTPGQQLSVEKLTAEAGDCIEFKEVLMMFDGDQVQMGAPFIDKCVVKAEVLEQTRAKKIDILKYKRRKHQMKHQGHRQYQTVVKITQVGDVKADAKPAEKDDAQGENNGS